MLYRAYNEKKNFEACVFPYVGDTFILRVRDLNSGIELPTTPVLHKFCNAMRMAEKVVAI